MKGSILANLLTKERMIVFLDPKKYNVLEMVNGKYGGRWVLVNRPTQAAIIKFECEEDYLGFDNRDDDNYCRGNLDLTAF